MGWSILAILGNPDASSAVSSRWECSNVIMWVHYYMSSRASFGKCFCSTTCIWKRENNITSHNALLWVCMICVIDDVDAMNALGCCVLCEWFHPYLWYFVMWNYCDDLECDAILPRKGSVTRAMSKRLQENWARVSEEGPKVLMNLRIDFWAHGPRLGPIIFVLIRLGCHYIWSLYLGLHNVGRVS